MTLVLVVFPSFSFAITFSEIMYDLSGGDTGREWVEIQNSTGSSVDIALFKFLESSGASNHGLTLIQGSANLSAGSFAVIASDPTKFLLDWPSFSGNLFKASFSMNNTGSTLILKDGDLNVKDQVNYSSDQGANGDGNSLQKSGSSWVSTSPTPGSQNSSSSNSTSTTTPSEGVSTGGSSSSEDSTSSSSSAHSSPLPLSATSQKILFEVSAGRERLTTVGSRVVFQAVATKGDGVTENLISYEWSFGDGTTAQGKIAPHAYRFAGEYVVILNARIGNLEAVSRTVVRVILPQVQVTKVSGGLEVYNKSSTEINLEDWSVVAQRKAFIFPKDTIIPQNKKVTFADSVTNLTAENLQVLNPIGQTVASWNNSSALSLPQSVVSTSTEAEILSLKNKLEEAKKELNRISPVAGNLATAEVPKFPILTPSSSTPDKTQTANVIEVFVAPRETSAINRIFNWPIRGINWVTRLFVEE